MASDIQEILDEHWALHSLKPIGADNLRTSDLPVETPAGAVIAATDSNGNRHVLIPLPANQRSRRTIDGVNLRVGVTPLETSDSFQRYLDVCSLNRMLDPLFNDLSADLLAAITTHPEQSLAVANDVLAKWKALFAPAPGKLGNDQVVGLFGELATLEMLLIGSPSAADTWRGPLGEPHDFVSTAGDIEVKATSAPVNSRARIHGLDQLQALANHPLHVHWVRVKPDEDGESIVALALRISEIVDDRDLFFTRLAAASVTPADRDRYPDRYSIVESIMMEVDDDFPRITAESLGQADLAFPISAVDYSIDLPLSRGLPQETTTELIQKIAGGIRK